MKTKKEKKYCPECGGSQVNHKFLYTSVLLGAIVEPCTNWMGNILPEESMEWMGPGFVNILSFLKIGSVTKEPKTDENYRTQVLWEEAKKRGIDLREFHMFNVGGEIFLSYYKNKNMRFFDVLPRPKKYNPDGLNWMDNKDKMKDHFKEAGIPVAHGAVTGNIKKAVEIFNSLRKPVITKPNIGSRSRHTRTHLSDEQSFIDGFKNAQMLSPWVMIEEELSGFVFRGTLIDKKLVAVIRREPAAVCGDGVHTIRELVEIENKNPLRNGPIFHKIEIGPDAEKELAHWNNTWETIPKDGVMVTLGQKTSRAVGGGITDMTDSMHPDNIALLEKVGEVVNDPLIGVDFIMDDVSISWKDQPRSGIIECNSAPFIDLHHYPLVGTPRNVAGKLWDIVYPESKIS